MTTPATPVPDDKIQRTGNQAIHPEKVAVDALAEYFTNEFPDDPAGALGKHFAKRSCKDCHARGIQTMIDPADHKKAEMRLCYCAQKRRDRYVRDVVIYERMVSESKEAAAKALYNEKYFDLPENAKLRAARAKAAAEKVAPPAPATP